MTDTPDTAADSGQVTDVFNTGSPFLRIISTYPADDGRYETVEVVLDPDATSLFNDSTDDPSLKAWVIDFCTFTIDALRRAPSPQVVMLTGAGAEQYLSDRIRHTDTCQGECGKILPTIPVDEPGWPAAEPSAESSPVQGGGA